MGAMSGSVALGKNGSRSVGRVCVLLSGGLDSAALLEHYLRRGYRVKPVYAAGGLRWEKAELYWTRRLLRRLGSSRLESLAILPVEQRGLLGAGHWALAGRVPGARAAWTAVYIEGRNFLLLSRAGMLAAREGIGRVALAVLKGNPFRDARPVFFRAMERSLAAALGRRVRVEAPFRRLEKRELIRRHPGLPFALTFSCIRPDGLRHCGRCSKCGERRLAFRGAGAPDPTEYRR